MGRTPVARKEEEILECPTLGGTLPIARFKLWQLADSPALAVQLVAEHCGAGQVGEAIG